MITTTNKYTAELLEEYNDIVKKTNYKNVFIILVVSLAMILIGIAVSTVILIVAGGIFLLFDIVIIFATLSMLKKTKESFDILRNPEVTYMFYDEHLEVIAKGETVDSKANFNYSDFASIIESENGLFITLKANSFYAIDKNNLSEDDLSTIKNYLFPYLTQYNFKRINKNTPLSNYEYKKKGNFFNNNSQLIALFCIFIPIFLFFALMLGVDKYYDLVLVGAFFPVSLISVVLLSVVYAKTRQKSILIDLILMSFFAMLHVFIFSIAILNGIIG